MARSRRWFLLLRAAVFMVVFMISWSRPGAVREIVADGLQRVDWSVAVAVGWGVAGGMLLMVVLTAVAVRAFCRALVGA